MRAGGVRDQPGAAAALPRIQGATARPGQGHPVAERLTFHGTSAAAIDKIVAEGFRIGGVDVPALAGASLGRAIYSSESSAFAMKCQWPHKSESERGWQSSSASIG